MYYIQLEFFLPSKRPLKCKNVHDLSFCNSHGTPSLIKILLDGHTVSHYGTDLSEKFGLKYLLSAGTGTELYPLL